jgi:hypothetical protein
MDNFASVSDGLISGADTSGRGSQRQNPILATLKRRIGPGTLVIYFVCHVVIVTAVSFLCWLWWGDRLNKSWRRIASGDHIKQAVPLAALCIRLAVSTIITLAISMIASIALERRGVSLKQLPKVSIARFTNTGQPFALGSLLFTKDFSNTLPVPFLVAGVWGTIIATQFTSTLLLSDLGQGPVLGSQTTENMSSGLTSASFTLDGYVNPNSPLFFTPSYWTNAVNAFETFAESSQPAGQFIEGLDDTGPTLRAFLPIGDQNTRDALWSFQGLASVFDSRVTCVRPTLIDLSFCQTGPIQLCGNFTIDVPVPGLVSPDGPIEFGSKIAAQYNQSLETRGSPWLLYFLDTSAGGLIPALDPTNNKSLKHTWLPKVSLTSSPSSELQRNGGTWAAMPVNSSGPSWLVDLGHAYIIMNASEPSQTNPGAHLLWKNSTTSGPWTEVEYWYPNSSVRSEYLRMSICYDSL